MKNTTLALRDGSIFTQRVSRLEFLKQICVVSGVLVAGCTPMKIVFKAYPERFKYDRNLREQMLRAFVTAVIPGAPEDDPDLVRMFTDDYYPFHEYCEFFAADLSSRSEKLFEDDRFDQRTLEERARVVQDGLEADATVARLYRGAILMAQVSFYAGIYNDEKGCSLIEFDGSNYGFTDNEMYHKDSWNYLAAAATSTGNYV